MSVYAWLVWAPVLVLQNFAFTFVSRARNSGSLKRHMVAAILSNGTWFASMLFTFSKMLDIINGKFGVPMAILAGLYYTGATLTGSLLAHYWSLRSEKGMARVGAYKTA